MNRIILVNRFYAPEHAATGQLLTDLARACVGNGWAVLVITSGPAHLPAREIDAGVQVIRIRRPAENGATIAGKGAAFTRFFFSAIAELGRVLRRGDVVVVLTDPPLLGIPVAALAAFRGARLVHWIQDTYPEVAVAVTGRRLLQLIAPLRNVAWRSAEACVTLGADMASVVRRAGVAAERTHIIPNWAPAGLGAVAVDAPAVVALRLEWGLADKFVVAYSGNLGRVHELDAILAAAEQLRCDAGLVFAFVGSGAQRPAVERRAKQRGLANVRFFPPQPRDQLGPALGVADVHLVSLRPGCEHTVFPSKLYGIAAVGRPVLFVGPTTSEIARLVSEEDLGIAVPPDGPSVARAVGDLRANPDVLARRRTRALDFASRHHASIAVANWCNLLRRTLAGSSPVGYSAADR